MAKIKVNPQSPTPQKKKAKGPLRLEAIVPITLVFLLFFAYFKLFFDSHLKWAIEYGATYANGAEVNVGSVNTSFLNASGKISNIQVTNKENPSTNIVQVGGMTFKTDWDGLLRGKIVISDASIDDIMVNTPRKRPGKVLPAKKSSENNMESVKGQALAETEKMLDGNIFGDIAAVAGGQDYKAKLKEMEGNLKSAQFIAKMEGELKEKEKLWKERIDKLPKNDEFKTLEARIKKLNVKGNAKDILKSAKEAEAIYKEVDAKVKAVEETKSALSSDVKQYKNIYGEVKNFVDQDVKDLGEKMGIPSLDAKDLGMRVFGRQFAGEIRRAEKYMRIAREYMPPPKKDRVKVEEFTPREREVGKDFKFPITKYYPKFWLKRAHINSKATEGGFSGTIGGEILNITTEPQTLGLPAEAKLTGDFPNSNIHNVVMHAVIDHTTAVPKESGLIKVGAFPLKDVMLSKSSDITYGFKSAQGGSELKAELQEENLKLSFDAGFDKIDYLVEAKSKKVQEILTNISQSLGPLTLSGGATGTWKSMDLSLRSNIGSRLQDALKQEFNKQVAGLKEKLQKEIESKIAGQQEKLMSQVGDLEKKIGISLKDQDAAIESLKGKLKAEKGKAKDKQIEEGAKKLFKGLKF